MSGNDESVLVVDDQAELAAVAAEYLALATTSIATGSSASATIARQSYDLIFSDIVMPGKNGFQLSPPRKRDNIPEFLLTSGFTAAASDARDSEARRRRLCRNPIVEPNC